MTQTEPARPAGRRLLPGQACRIHVSSPETDRLLYTTTERLYEAPNWAPDAHLVVNGDGLLWDLPLDGSSEPRPIETPGLPPVNNDHLLSPDGATIYASANDGHIHAVPRHGGAARRITPDDGRLHFLHGVDPTGEHLAYVAITLGEPTVWIGHVRVIGVDGSGDHAVTQPGERHDDGPEYSPDGEWILFNTERFTTAAGHGQLARVRPDGSGLERLAETDRVDWFPHLSPDARHGVYISFPAGTLGHPENLPVRLNLVEAPDWRRPVRTIELFGGQGTINVTSWAPDSASFAWVDYPLGD